MNGGRIFVLWVGCLIGGVLSILILGILIDGFSGVESPADILGAAVILPVPAAIFSIPGLLVMLAVNYQLNFNPPDPVKHVDALALSHLIISLIYLAVYTFGQGMQGMATMSAPFLGFGMLLWFREMWLVRKQSD